MSTAEYKIKLEAFEGPLALLMHLIDKNQIDIYDIPIAVVTEQYLAYIRTMEQFNIDVASEFLVMAATLLQIKSRMLLPKPPAAELPAEEDPRQELVQRLLEYRRFKQAAATLEEMLREREQYISRPPGHFATKIVLPEGLKIDDLIEAFAAVWESAVDEFAFIAREEISIQDKMQDILLLLRKQGGRIEFAQTLIRSGSRTEMVTAFLALLELIRLKRVQIEQERNFGPIYLSLGEVVH
ncbi:segregation and condensation protein A [Anaeroselena agilis]|uniref:Segregation and condensation protein A n=1 Tax=Anaeroselena agilis TaxID=3063788 RepID=A0ABU3NWC1_9FIRM|nr:segregation/condensation protein A [Selenomonadales bacterium 4137-cl]